MSSECDKGSEGCVDQNACNYDDLATIDDGNCWYASYGCTCDDPIDSYIDCLGICDSNPINDPPDDDNDGICNEDVIGGCLDGSNCSYNSIATHNDGSCSVDLSKYGSPFSDGRDCNGNCGGVAIVDACDLCIGGQTIYGKCWQVEIETIVTFKLNNNFYMGSDTNTIIIGASNNSLDGYNVSSENEDLNCTLNYSDAPAFMKDKLSANKNNFVNYFISHENDHEWDEWWGENFNFNRDIRKNDYLSIFTENKGMTWFATIEPTLSDTIFIDEGGNYNTYSTFMDSIKFNIRYLEGIQCADINIYLDREREEYSGGILIENNVGAQLNSDKRLYLSINVTNICTQQNFDRTCP